MTPKELCDYIRRYCRTNADEKLMQKYRRFFKEGYDSYGLSREIFDDGVTSIMADGPITLRLILDAAPLLLKTGKYEETSFALALAKKFIPEYSRETFTEMEKWFQYGISNWAHADSISLDIFPIFLTNGIVPLRSFSSWRSSSYKYQRRVAAVAMINYLKKGADLGPLLKFMEPLMTDPQREVHQGVGWFLREAWKLHPAETEAFLLKWKNDGARLIYQYATEKMLPKQRQVFKRDSKK